jgi:purine nucleoside permease
MIKTPLQFLPEGEAWYDIPEFNVLEHNITIPGFSPLFPDAHCTRSGEVCQLITGEAGALSARRPIHHRVLIAIRAEINAASTLSALVASPEFDLTSTYFLIAGIAGANPTRITTNGIALARYAVQVALQYEIDPREAGTNFSSGYFAFETVIPDTAPGIGGWFGTEVFELNDALRKRVGSAPLSVVRALHR